MKFFATPIWVRLPNFPLHWIWPNILEDIGDSISCLIKINSETLKKSIIIFIHICVEVDNSEGLRDKTILMCDGKDYLQPLDYENITFSLSVAMTYSKFMSLF